MQTRKVIVLSTSLLLGACTHALLAAEPNEPGCDGKTPKQCVEAGIDAMGGRARLEAVRSVRVRTLGHLQLTEQSDRQEPFNEVFFDNHAILDFDRQRMWQKSKATGPIADPTQDVNETEEVATNDGCVRKLKDSAIPCGRSDLDDARHALALGPERLLLTAAAAPDLHYEKPEELRATPHAVVAFEWRGFPVRVLLNRDNHLPDAIETTRTFNDFWYAWGDVAQQIYFDNYQLFHGVVYPTNFVEFRNGIQLQSAQVVDVELNPPTDEKLFAMDPTLAAKTAASQGWNRPFAPMKTTEIFPGVVLFEGAWNTTIVKQADGIVVVEAPIGEPQMQGVFDEAKRRYPGLPIKTVLSTSDSWPHFAGVRFVVSQGVPVYILDLNKPLLDRQVAAPFKLSPDTLEKHRRPPIWKIVAGKAEVGNGDTRVELYPLRGTTTERQYMVYFPEKRLLYASDTIGLQGDTLFDPENFYEVMQAVEREHLDVETVFAMHQGPMPWKQAVELVGKALH